MRHKAKTLQNLFSGRTGKENISSYTRYKEALLIMIIMQINTRTACTTTRRIVDKRGNAAAV